MEERTFDTTVKMDILWEASQPEADHGHIIKKYGISAEILSNWFIELETIRKNEMPLKKRGKPRKQFCLRGHDTSVVGRSYSRCKSCIHEDRQRHKHEIKMTEEKGLT